MQRYVDETMEEKFKLSTKSTAMMANFEELFCGVIVELLTK